MSPKSRQLVVSLHVVLAGFFLPSAIMFSITGGLYTFGVKGSYDTKTELLELALPNPQDPSLGDILPLAEKYLSEKGVQPSGGPGLRKVGTSWAFEWSGSNYDFSLEPTPNSPLFKTSLKQTDWHRFFVQLHKAKGGYPFKVLAGALAVAFILMFASGVALAFTTARLKRQMYFSLALGLAIFAGLAAIS